MAHNRKGNSPKIRYLNYVLVAAIMGMALALSVSRPGDSEPKKVPLSQAMADVKTGKVAKAQVQDGQNKLTLTLTKDAGGGKVVADYPFAYSDTLTQALIDAKVETKAVAPERPNPLWGLFTALLPLVIIIGLLLYLSKGGLTGGIGKFTGKRGKQMGEVPTTRFADVAGCDEAKAEMQELVEFLKDGERFTRLGAKAPRGGLLVGPPGTGKTMLARAVAGEAGVPFFPLAGSDFVETFVGVGAKRVRDLFDEARKAGAAIIFIDEIDAVGRARSAGPSQGGGNSEQENTLISMLNEMDGFDDSHRIIVLAATNRADVLDPALTRPGRLDRQIQVPNPDRRGRTDILEVHTKGKPIADDVDLVGLARRTPGTSGAVLAQIVNEACMYAARRNQDKVDAKCFDKAVATVLLGRERTSALVTEQDRQITAWHEAGHTLAALLLESADDPVSVSIVPRGPAGGVTWMSGNDNIFLTRAQALAGLRVSMAGRAAEEILLNGEYTQGAHGDLEAATQRAMAMVTQYGMSSLGYLVADADTIRMGGPVAMEVRRVAEELLQEAYEEAAALLHANHDLLVAVANELLEKETLVLSEILEVRDRVRSAASIAGAVA